MKIDVLISVHLIDGHSVGTTLTLSVRAKSGVPDAFYEFATRASTEGLMLTENGILTFYPPSRIARIVLSSAYG